MINELVSNGGCLNSCGIFHISNSFPGLTTAVGCRLVGLGDDYFPVAYTGLVHLGAPNLKA